MSVHPPHNAPDWEEYERQFCAVHDWRTYIKEPLRAVWDTFTDEQQRLMAENADAIATAEEWD